MDKLHPGDKVRFTDHPWEGYIGEYLRTDDIPAMPAPQRTQHRFRILNGEGDEAYARDDQFVRAD